MAALNSGNVDNALRQKFRLKWKLLHLPIGAINLLKVIEGRPRGCPRLIIFKPAIGRYDYWLMLLKTVRILAVDEMIWITRRCRNTQWFYFHFSRHQNIFMSSEDVSQKILRCFFFFFPKSQVPSLSKKGSFDSDLDFPGWLECLGKLFLGFRSSTVGAAPEFLLLCLGKCLFRNILCSGVSWRVWGYFYKYSSQMKRFTLSNVTENAVKCHWIG